MKLSIIMPVYNEVDTIKEILRQVISVDLPVAKELIVVDDGSSDGTREFLQNLKKKIENPEEKNLSTLVDPLLITDKLELTEKVSQTEIPAIKVLFHQKNHGKGAALKTGFQHAVGDILVIQDADLEYDPVDWKDMLRPILEDRADVVFGSRFYGKPHRALYYHHFLGNRIICTLINLLCDITLSDAEVCYKMFRRDVLKSLNLVSNDFGFEVEFTVKVSKSKKWRIYETAVSYYGRTYAEGKKINWKDGFKAFWYIFKFRFS